MAESYINSKIKSPVMHAYFQRFKSQANVYKLQ